MFTTLMSETGEQRKQLVCHIKHFLSKDFFFDRWTGCEETDLLDDLINISLQIGKRRIREGERERQKEREITSEHNFWKIGSLCLRCTRDEKTKNRFRNIVV
jgi:hypothetical protein